MSRFRRAISGAWILASAASLTQCQGAGAPAPDRPVAIVGLDTLTVAGLHEAYERAEEVDTNLGAAELTGDLIQRFINRALLLQEADRRRLARTQNAGRYAQGIRRKVAADAIRERIYDGKLTVTEEAVRELYERYSYTFEVRHLSVRDADLAAELRSSVLAGEDFGDLAARHSDDRTSATNGGSLGEMTAGQLFVKYEDAVFELEPGEITEVIPAAGEHYKLFQLVRMDLNREPPPFDALRPALEDRVFKRLAGAAKTDFQKGLLKTHAYRLGPDYETFANELRDRIEALEATNAVTPDSLPDYAIFDGWAPDQQQWVIAEFNEGRVTTAEFLKRARGMKTCPTCLWRDNDVEIQQAVLGIAFDRIFDIEVAMVQKEGLPEVEAEAKRLIDDRLAQMALAIGAVAVQEIEDDEIKAYMAEHPEQFTYPSEARVRRLVVADEALANDLRQRLDGGADFATLVERHSIDENSNFRGGVTDYFHAGRRMQGMAEHAFAHEIGDRVGPFQSKMGWEIIEVIDFKAERPQTFQEGRERAAAILSSQRTQAGTQAMLDSLRASAQITLFEDVAKRVTYEGIERSKH